jgi:hypothetical protein
LDKLQSVFESEKTIQLEELKDMKEKLMVKLMEAGAGVVFGKLLKTT